MKEKIPKVILKTILKVLISFTALYIVFKKIDLEKVKSVLLYIHWISLIMALLLLNLSQWVSSCRLKYILGITGVDISFKKNLALYYKGMFYNLFLPGGVGGDGYKVYQLNRWHKQPVKMLIGSLLLDRLAGLIGILFLATLTLALCKPRLPFHFYTWEWITIATLTYPAFYVFILIFFKRYKSKFISICALGISVNIVQAFCALAILFALGETENCIHYIAAFYVSSVALVIPFTVGGIGTRELVFTFAPTILPVEMPIGIALCIILFLINTISSLFGAFIRFDNKTII